MAGKVDFTPKFLPLICQIRTVAKVAIPLSMLHRIMHVWWQSKFTAALQGRTQDSRIWEQLRTYNKQVHLFLHSTMTMEE